MGLNSARADKRHYVIVLFICASSLHGFVTNPQLSLKSQEEISVRHETHYSTEEFDRYGRFFSHTLSSIDVEDLLAVIQEDRPDIQMLEHEAETHFAFDIVDEYPNNNSLEMLDRRIVDIIDQQFNARQRLENVLNDLVGRSLSLDSQNDTDQIINISLLLRDLHILQEKYALLIFQVTNRRFS